MILLKAMHKDKKCVKLLRVELRDMETRMRSAHICIKGVLDFGKDELIRRQY